MLVDDRKDGGVQAAAGLFCSMGRDVLQRDGDRHEWQTALPSEFEAFDLDPLARFQPSPDGQHAAFVALRGVERSVCILSLPGPLFRCLPTVLTRVVGMSWSPGGKRLCVVARDPSVGVLPLESSQPQGALPVFSLLMAGKDDPDLLPVTGPIALPGIPRWSPAGDAVAVVGLEHGGAQVVLVVTTDGREGPLVSGERVMLGTCAWTADGLLLCAVSERRDGVHVQLVNTATGESIEQGEVWEDVCWLSLVDNRVLVAGKSGGTWCVADVTGGSRRVLTASFAHITEVAATPEHLWVVAPVENGDLGLWSWDLRGEHLHLHVAATSIRGMQMRVDGRTVAVMAGPVGAETVRIATLDDEEVLDIGQRGMIMGWIEKHTPHGHSPRLHYLLTPTYQALDDWMDSSEPAGDVEMGTIAMEDAPEPLAPAVPMEPREEEQPGSAREKVVFVDNQTETDFAPVPGQPVGRGRRLLRLVGTVAIILLVVAGAVLAVQGMRRAQMAAYGTPTVSTPSTPSGTIPGASVTATPSAVTVTPAVPPSTPSVVAQRPSTPPPVIETYGVKPGLWVAPTEQVRVRSAAGTDHKILGYLSVIERARVLAGPTILETVPWWNVRCYGTDGKARLTGWVSGVYVRPSSAPVVVPVVTPSAPVIPKPVAKPTTGTVTLSTVPAGARVVVNGVDRGVTPVSMVLPGKEVFITVSLPGYLDYSATVTVVAGKTTSLTWRLILLP